MAQAGVKNVSLTSLDDVVCVAQKAGYIESDEAAKILAFRNNPTSNDWMEQK